MAAANKFEWREYLDRETIWLSFQYPIGPGRIFSSLTNFYPIPILLAKSSILARINLLFRIERMAILNLLKLCHKIHPISPTFGYTLAMSLSLKVRRPTTAVASGHSIRRRMEDFKLPPLPPNGRRQKIWANWLDQFLARKYHKNIFGQKITFCALSNFSDFSSKTAL